VILVRSDDSSVFITYYPLVLNSSQYQGEALIDRRRDGQRDGAKGTRPGGETYNEPQDHGFMYEHGFEDLDGHIWELIYMQPTTAHRGWR
jgi:uncharacterized protein